jgi:hypothetical protein
VKLKPPAPALIVWTCASLDDVGVDVIIDDWAFDIVDDTALDGNTPMDDS